MIIRMICLLVSLSLSAPFVSAAIVVGSEYDENTIQANEVDVSATPYTKEQAAVDAAAAFAANLGGVIDFDNGTITDPNRLDVIFASGQKTLLVRNDTLTWTLGNLGTGTAGAMSGARVLFNGAPDPFPTPFLNRIVFEDVVGAGNASTGEQVTKFGVSVLDLNPNLNGGTNNLGFVVTFSDNSTTSLDHTIPGSVNQFDTFFGFEAPNGLSIRQVDITANNNLATDDWVFQVAPSAIPEPSSVLLLGALGLAYAVRRRRPLRA